MRIKFDVQKAIEAKGWESAWYELEDLTKTVARNLQHSLWRAYTELGGQIAQPEVSAVEGVVTVETAHSEIEGAVREAFDGELLDALSREYPDGFFDEEAASLTDDILFGENGEVDSWVDYAHDRLMELGVEWSGLSGQAELVNDKTFSEWVDFVRVELEDALSDFRVERENPLLGVSDLMSEGFYLDLAESVRVQGFECDGKDAARVQDLINDLEENPQVTLGEDEVHELMLKSDDFSLVRIARRIKDAGLYDVEDVVKECVSEYVGLFWPDLAEEWPDVAEATRKSVKALIDDIEGGDHPLDCLCQEAQNACIYYADVIAIISAIGLDEIDNLVDEPGIALETGSSEDLSLSMVFTRLAAMALERLTVTYAVESFRVLAGELES
jgi:hypothetical protein